MKGLKIFMQSQTIKELKVAVDYFKQAIKLDSTYAKAYAHLSTAYLRYPYFCELTPIESLQLAAVPNNIALQLDPQLTLAHLNQFDAMYSIKWNWEEALNVLSNVESLSQNDPMVLSAFVSYYVVSGKFDKAFETCEKIRQISPTENVYWQSLIFTQLHSRDLEGAIRTSQEALKLFHDDGPILEMQMWCFSLLGMHDDAVKVARQIIANDRGFNPIHLGEVGAVLARAGLKDEALQQLEIIHVVLIPYTLAKLELS